MHTWNKNIRELKSTGKDRNIKLEMCQRDTDAPLGAIV